MWVLYLKPKIEDGNNFGVSIQEEIVRKIRIAEERTIGFYNRFGNYHANRALFVRKVGWLMY